MPTALSNRHSHSKSKQYLERQPISCLGPTRSWFQIQWPCLDHPCWGTALSYHPCHSVFLCFLSFQWLLPLLCCLSAGVLNVGMPQTSEPDLYLILFIFFSCSSIKNRKTTVTHCYTNQTAFSAYTYHHFYIILFIHTHTHTHTHTKYFYLCFSIISFSLLEHKLHENNNFRDLLIYASERRLTYRRRWTKLHWIYYTRNNML